MFGQQTVCLAKLIGQQDSFLVARSVGIVQQGRIPLHLYNLNSFPVTLQKYQQLGTVTAISLEDARNDNCLSLEEVNLGVVEVHIGHVGKLDPPAPYHALSNTRWN